MTFATFVCVAALYIRTAYPSVPGGDSGELISTSHELGVGHPPGYPTWILLNHAWTRGVCPLVLPHSSPANCANSLSALFGAGAAALLQATTAALAGGDAGAGVVAATLFATARLQWMYSIQGEVFALNNILVALLLYILVRFEQSVRPRTAVAGAFVCGLALSNQLTAVLFIVLIVPWVLLRLWRRQMLQPATLACLAIAFLLGFSPYLFLPYSAWQNTARLTWGDQRTIAGFLRHVTQSFPLRLLAFAFLLLLFCCFCLCFCFCFVCQAYFARGVWHVFAGQGRPQHKQFLARHLGWSTWHLFLSLICIPSPLSHGWWVVE